jgi:hypothetical protein
LCVVLLKEYLVPEAYGPEGDAHAPPPPNFCGRAKVKNFLYVCKKYVMLGNIFYMPGKILVFDWQIFGEKFFW